MLPAIQMRSAIIGALLSTGMCYSAQAATAFITFDDLPTGPSTFGAPPSTITYPQASFSGGTILGFAANFPQAAFSTSPNVYGTFSCCGMPEMLTIAINPAFPTNEVSFPLFNGETFSQSYTVSAFDASNTLLTSLHFANIPSNATSNGFAIVDLSAAGIALVTITPDGAPVQWDFLIDSIALNESVQTAFGGDTTPLPAALPLFASGLGALGLIARRKRRKNAATIAA